MSEAPEEIWLSSWGEYTDTGLQLGTWRHNPHPEAEANIKYVRADRIAELKEDKKTTFDEYGFYGENNGPLPETKKR